jgi:prolipoprotein diacylglyceryltransferase
MVIYAAIFGFSGAKIFHNLENWDDFVKNPLEALVSFSGLTFYGGLICAGIAILFYAKKHKVEIIHLTDSFAPALMLGYAIGRIGCHVSGDGDWGILNSAFVSTETGAMRLSKYGDYNNLLIINKNFFIGQFGGLNLVRNINQPSIFHLPDWLFAYNYPHNVISEGVHLLDCKTIQYCNQLPIPVFPTALYEAIICSILFVLLQILGKYISKAGLITGIYFMLNGLERFFIEKIRVNTRYEHLPFTPTQAELISVCLIIFGGFIFVRFYLKKAQVNLDVA